ncbi:hypothetical protein [Amycolatopsis sp. cg9]|uniref:hypothetical protein n=1 Tax=Amycolatopsis sp. cg9 TaxID=3238801 RepID=UPI0035233078
MPSLAELEQIARHPEPAYPEYDALRAQTTAVFGPFVSPQEVDEGTAVLRAHTTDWASAVLGRPFPGSLRAVSTTDARLLILAHRRELDPPLPERLRRWQTEAEQHERAQTERREAAQRQRRQRWETVRAGCAVAVEVRFNTRHAGKSGPLGHVVPRVDVRSPRRRHPAGRALCETPRRSSPLVLGEPVDEPATCERCLEFARTVQPAA